MYSIFFKILVLILVLSTIGIIGIKPKMHNKVLIYDSSYSIVENNSDTEEIERRIVDSQGFPPSYVIDKTKWETRNYVMPPIEVWLNGFASSEYILTDSYHGTVFAIIFNKPFVVYANKRRGVDRF